ncbi:MAG: 30S ribosomal protein S10 [Candidatus Baldrarchaeia archaeon]
MQKAKIRLTSTNAQQIEEICQQIKNIAQRTGVHISGPIPLPTKKLKVPIRKSPCGEGTATWEHYILKLHKRLVIIDADERTLRQIMRIRIPPEVFVELEVT